ncbi:MAG: AAA family ATPase [Puniceicoccales bacterium]|jgi:endopeptidase Clp ATP-binding regulatory subunit ClpX|nr:AAA family ATPase [Puniceicoccales bacterium]
MERNDAADEKIRPDEGFPDGPCGQEVPCEEFLQEGMIPYCGLASEEDSPDESPGNGISSDESSGNKVSGNGAPGDESSRVRSSRNGDSGGEVPCGGTANTGATVEKEAGQAAPEQAFPQDETPNNPLEEFTKKFSEILNRATNIQITPLMYGETPTESAPASTSSEEREPITPLDRIESFNFKPREVKDYLDRFVIEQHAAKKVLSVAICDHYHHVRRCIENPMRRDQDYNKQNILILGPTGVGKTYLVRHIARLIGVPFVKADATKFSETGYVGNDVEDLVRDLVKAANGDTHLAQYGIIFIDEIDKIAGSGDQRDVSGRGVQINLLKLLEDTEVSLMGPNDVMRQMRSMMNPSRSRQADTLSTRNILFIVSGAFDKLDEIIRRRVGASSMGFSGQSQDPEADTYAYFQRAKTEDFIRYGFEPEFIGRLPVRVACQALKRKELKQILISSEGSILRQYQEDFLGYGIHLELTDEALELIAARAEEEKTGARGLLTVLENCLRDFKFELPSTTVSQLQLTADVVRQPLPALQSLLRESVVPTDSREAIERFCQAFAKMHGLSLALTEEAMVFLEAQSEHSGKSLRATCDIALQDFHHGLPLLARRTGQRQFLIGLPELQNPGAALHSWFQQAPTPDPSPDASDLEPPN